MSTVHCGTDTAPNGVQHTLLALHRDTVGTFGTATGNDNQFWKSIFDPVQFHKSFRDCIASSVPLHARLLSAANWNCAGRNFWVPFWTQHNLQWNPGYAAVMGGSVVCAAFLQYVGNTSGSTGSQMKGYDGCGVFIFQVLLGALMREVVSQRFFNFFCLLSGRKVFRSLFR